MSCVDADMYEMLMIQNAQMHQMIMQQLMLSNLSSRPPPPPPAAAAVNGDTLSALDVKELIDVSITMQSRVLLFQQCRLAEAAAQIPHDVLLFLVVRYPPPVG